VFAGTAFFEKTYREALDLLRETRDYLAYCHERDMRNLRPIDRLRFSLESTRLTARLTGIMAWLFVQKALEAGELTALEAARESHCLLRREVCLAGAAPAGDLAGNAASAAAEMPRGLTSLLERSRRLYARIARLDELTAREPA
jgi:regulator of CtrA degradation